MGACPDRWGEFKTTFSWKSISPMADQAWARMGVRCVSDYWDDNHYYINGREVNRKEAYDYVAQKLGKTYNKDKFFPQPCCSRKR